MLKRKLTCVALTALCLTGGCGLLDEPCVCGVKNWKTFSPRDERFSVFMPAEPTTTMQTLDTAAGKIASHLATVELPEHTWFAVMWYSFPPEVDLNDKNRLFEMAQKQVAQKYGEPQSSKDVVVQGVPGREWVFDFQNKAQVNFRFFIVGRDGYSVYTLMPKARVCPKHTQEFLDSFRVKQA